MNSIQGEISTEGNSIGCTQAMISEESQFSEILLYRNLLIALQPIGLSKFCKKYGVTHTLCKHLEARLKQVSILSRLTVNLLTIFFKSSGYAFLSHTVLQTSFFSSPWNSNKIFHSSCKHKRFV